MIKFFKLRVPEYFTSHSKPERFRKYFAKEERFRKIENKRAVRPSVLKTLKGGNRKL